MNIKQPNGRLKKVVVVRIYCVAGVEDNNGGDTTMDDSESILCDHNKLPGWVTEITHINARHINVDKDN